jgi:hypothetical protein
MCVKRKDYTEVPKPTGDKGDVPTTGQIKS